MYQFVGVACILICNKSLKKCQETIRGASIGKINRPKYLHKMEEDDTYLSDTGYLVDTDMLLLFIQLFLITYLSDDPSNTDGFATFLIKL